MENLVKSKKAVIAVTVVTIILVIILFLFMTKAEAERVGIIKPKVSHPVEQDTAGDAYDTSIEYEEVKFAFEAYGCKYIENVDDTYFVNFAKDIFKEDGSPNVTYFENLIHSVAKTAQLTSFVINDEKKQIEIEVVYNKNGDTFSYSINNIPGYFQKINYDAYKKVSEIQPVQYNNISIKNELLKKLKNNNMRIINELGSGNAIGTEGQYSIFFDKTVKTRNYNGRVRNIVFYNDYPDEIFEGIKVGIAPNIILQTYPKYAFKDDNYVAYRTKDFYVFCYKDEISIYPYSYKDNQDMLDYIDEYIEDKNIKKFSENVRRAYANYDYYEFDEEQKNLSLHYPANGIMIDIKNNNSDGIVVYNNFYITEKLKKQAAEGKIRLELLKNSIEEEEKARINN